MTKREAAVIALIAASVSPIIAEALFTLKPSSAYPFAVVIGVGTGYIFNFLLNTFIKELLKLLENFSNWFGGRDKDGDDTSRD